MFEGSGDGPSFDGEFRPRRRRQRDILGVNR